MVVFAHFSIICSDVDQVHDIMDDLAEQHEVANEISEAISGPVGFGQDYDEVTLYVIRHMFMPPIYQQSYKLWDAYPSLLFPGR